MRSWIQFISWWFSALGDASKARSRRVPISFGNGVRSSPVAHPCGLGCGSSSDPQDAQRAVRISGQDNSQVRTEHTDEIQTETLRHECAAGRPGRLGCSISGKPTSIELGTRAALPNATYPDVADHL